MNNNNLPYTTPIEACTLPLSLVKYYVIGISNNPQMDLSAEVKKIVQQHQVFSGGKRHYELIKEFLPTNHQWIEIAKEMSVLFETYKKIEQPIVVFASGDPLFYGFANTIKKNDPTARVQIYPHFNSLQLLCQKNTIPYQNMLSTSVHGRSWKELDIALLQQTNLIGVLTDATKTPSAIAQRMLDYNFDNYTMIVGEALEGENEKISSLSLEAASLQTFDALNCLLLLKKTEKKKQFGIKDAAFIGLENRPNMITKMPIRLISLSQLDLPNRKTFWDVGFCTGSVSIEAKTQFPHLDIFAFEIREECSSIFDENTKKHSTPGINKLIGDFFEIDLNTVTAPDTVFIGGHGNRLEELILLIDQYLVAGGRIVMNTVKNESKETFIKCSNKINYQLLESIEITLDKHNPITILTAEKRKNE
ncbi:precorrin-6y C5,15-methyltransferase (decarboxylating) subunit CbiE [Flavobacterium oreochromis]|uniref:precorrin-6y C5,15-methyltransferase (decarboxylating) subunit CbiE n=1 Tax=Flavobacterium oreochromis TaxID=2906078 RepID=UPI003857FF67